MAFQQLDGRARREAALAIGASVAAAVACVLTARWLAWPVVDDAGISIAYGRTFFEGHGLRLTAASQPVEGFSSPLWTLLLGLSVPLRADGEAFARGLSLAVGALAVGALALWGPLSRGRPPQLQDAVAPWLAAASPSLVAWISSGMETGPWVLALTVAGALALRGMRVGQGTAAGWALGVLVWVRPEAPLYLAAVAVVWLVHCAVVRRNPLRELFQALPGIVVLGLALVALRWMYFADLVPNTYWAKRFWDFDAAGYLRGFRDGYGWLLVSGLVGLVASVSGGWRSLRPALVAALFAVATFAFAWSARGDWMTEWRFLVASLPFCALAVEVALSSVREVLGALSRPPPRSEPASPGAGAVLDQPTANGAAGEAPDEVSARSEPTATAVDSLDQLARPSETTTTTTLASPPVGDVPGEDSSQSEAASSAMSPDAGALLGQPTARSEYAVTSNEAAGEISARSEPATAGRQPARPSGSMAATANEGVPTVSPTLRPSETVTRRPSVRRRVLAGALGLGVVATLVPAVHQLLDRRDFVKRSPQFPLSFVAGNARRLAPVLAAFGQRRPLLGLPDLGGVGLELRDAEILDVAGLADRSVARAAGNLPALQDYLLYEGPPTVVDVHGPSGHVGALSRLMAELQPAAGMYVVRGLTPNEDPRCPGGKAAVLALSPEALLAQLADDLATDPVRGLRRWRCAWAYQPDERLPSRAARRALVAAALERSQTRERTGDLEGALRCASLATVLADQDAHLRRRVDQLRLRLFPAPPR